MSLAYGPRDVVLLDGSFAHAVTMLQGLKGVAGRMPHGKFDRFSLLTFNNVIKEKRMPSKSTVWDAHWREEWRNKLI
eukprot:2077900-Prymnesium_polylepis.1